MENDSFQKSSYDSHRQQNIDNDKLRSNEEFMSRLVKMRNKSMLFLVNFYAILLSYVKLMKLNL